LFPHCEEEPFINKYQVPRIEKIVINRGLGDKMQNTQSSLDELSIIAGQRGVLIKSNCCF
jgi:ribosomal protein L5